MSFAQKIFVFSVFLVVCAINLPFPASAQEAYTLYTTPEHPSHGETVVIGIQGASESPRNIRSIRWSIDGKSLNEENNKTSIERLVTSTPQQISVRIIYSDVFGGNQTLNLTKWIVPSVVDIFWESVGVTTPLYKGYKLATRGTPIRLTAEIQYIDERGKVFDENDFFFVWSVSSEEQSDVSGPGSNSFVLEATNVVRRSYLPIKMEAQLGQGQGVLLEKKIRVPIISPRVLVYNSNLSQGLNTRRVVGNRDVAQQNPISLSVYPFYFSESDFEQNKIQYNWFVNGGRQPIRNSRRVSFSYEGDESPVTMDIQVQNANTRSQNSSRRFSFSF